MPFLSALIAAAAANNQLKNVAIGVELSSSISFRPRLVLFEKDNA